MKWQDKRKNDPVILQSIRKKLEEITKEEDINFQWLSYDELNKDIEKDEHKIVGRYVYFTKGTEPYKSVMELKELLKEENEVTVKYLKEHGDDVLYPKIQLAKNTNYKLLDNDYNRYLTWVHELGHHFLEKREQEQSEESADRYLLEFLTSYFPRYYLSILYYSLISRKIEIKEPNYLISYLQYYQDKYFKKLIS